MTSRMKLIVKRLSIKRQRLPKHSEDDQLQLSNGSLLQGPLSSVADTVPRDHTPVTAVIKKTPMGVLKTSKIVPKESVYPESPASPESSVKSEFNRPTRASNLSSTLHAELLLATIPGKSSLRLEKKKLSRLPPPSEKDEEDSDDLASHSPSRKLEALYKRRSNAFAGNGSLSSGDLRGDLRELKKSKRADSHSIGRSSSSLKEGSSSDLRRHSISSTPVLVPYTSNKIRIPQRNGQKHNFLGNNAHTVLTPLNET